MSILPQNILAWTIAESVYHAFAFATTSARLYIRIKDRAFWWNDALVAFVLFLDIGRFCMIWLNYTINNPSVSTHARIIMYWMNVVLPISVIWLCRISMTITLSTVLPKKSRLRSLTYGLSVFWLCLYLMVILLFVGYCTVDQSWHKSPVVACSRVDWEPGVLTEFTGAASLVILPLILRKTARLAGENLRISRMIYLAANITALHGAMAVAFVIAGVKIGPGAPIVGMFLCAMGAIAELTTSNLFVLYKLFPRKVQAFILYKIFPQIKGHGLDDTGSFTSSDSESGSSVYDPEDWQVDTIHFGFPAVVDDEKNEKKVGIS